MIREPLDQDLDGLCAVLETMDLPSGSFSAGAAVPADEAGVTRLMLQVV
jgi:hypothetical protein